MLLGNPIYYQNQYFVAVLVILFLLALFFKNGKEMTSTFRFVDLMILVLMLATQFTSALYGHFTFQSRIPLIAIELLTVMTISRFEITTLLQTFYTAGVIVLVMGWIFFLLGFVKPIIYSGYSFNPFPYRWTGTFDHPNISGAMASLIASMSLGSKNRAILAFSMVTLVVTEHRGGFLAFTIVALFYVLINLKRVTLSRNIFYIFSILTLFIAASYFLIGRNGTGDVTSGRRTIWNACFDLINSGGKLGYGPLTIVRTNGSLATSGNFDFFHCHNQILDDWVNFGIVGALIPTVLVIRLLVNAFKTRHFSAVVVGIIFLVIGLVEAPFRIWATQNSTWIVVLIFSTFLSVGNIRDQSYKPNN